MIKKIISGGQTGADRAALDVAIQMGIAHGGWIPKGRKAEDGRLPDKYQLQEMPTDSYPSRTEQNVIDSDGTLIFSRGTPTGGTEYTRQMVLKHKKHLLHIDLNIAPSYDAASLIRSWIGLQNIQTLNVAGPRASKDSRIYVEVFRILEMAYVMGKVQENRKASQSVNEITKLPAPPRTVEQAAERLITELSLKDKITIANMAEIELGTLHLNLGEYIRNEFGLWSGNEDLIKSCCRLAGSANVHQDEASSVIIRELWKQLKESHKLRVVK
jgi:hypothetical protein